MASLRDAAGYTAMFRRMLDHPVIEVRLATDDAEVAHDAAAKLASVLDLKFTRISVERWRELQIRKAPESAFRKSGSGFATRTRSSS